MGLNSTPSAERIHIGFFGLRNAGKSSLVNKITNQELSVVSDIKGTTTDIVKKPMELLPLGAIVIIDTPGIDDSGELGAKRVEAAKRALNLCDIAVLVSENKSLSGTENELVESFKRNNMPYIIVKNKADIKHFEKDIAVSAKTGFGIEELKEKLASLAADSQKSINFISDFINKGDTAVLVTPIDESAPKGRMIMPQQLAIRDIIDNDGVAIVTQVEELTSVLNNLNRSPALVCTDSQAFSKVMRLVPDNIPLTSFSILMARYKGFLDTALKGANALNNINKGANILISEGCTHHRQCNDIGTVKLPKWIKEYTNKEFCFEFTSGHGFPENLSKYDLIIHCGGCMLNDKEMKSRMENANKQGIPFTNYGMVIAKMNGILERSTEILKSSKI